MDRSTQCCLTPAARVNVQGAPAVDLARRHSAAGLRTAAAETAALSLEDGDQEARNASTSPATTFLYSFRRPSRPVISSFHHLLSRSYLYRCVQSVITAHDLALSRSDESILGHVQCTVAVVSRSASNSHTSSWVMKQARYNTSVHVVGIDYARLHSHNLVG